MMKTKNIMIVGVGGQGTLFAGKILGIMAVNAGYHMKTSEVHGMAQRGGSVVAHIRYGQQVYEPVVEEGQADLIIALEELEALRYAHFLKKEGMLFINPCRIKPASVLTGIAKYPKNVIETLENQYHICRIDAQRAAKKNFTVKAMNMIMLGAAAHYLQFAQEDGLKAIKENVPEEICSLNQQAFVLGYQMWKCENGKMKEI